MYEHPPRACGTLKMHINPISIIIPILQVGKVRHTEVSAGGHIASQGVRMVI